MDNLELMAAAVNTALSSLIIVGCAVLILSYWLL